MLTHTIQHKNVGATSLSRAPADTRKGFRDYKLSSEEFVINRRFTSDGMNM